MRGGTVGGVGVGSGGVGCCGTEGVGVDDVNRGSRSEVPMAWWADWLCTG